MRDRLNHFRRAPMVTMRSVVGAHGLYLAAETDRVGGIMLDQLPRIAARQPLFRLAVLPAIGDLLIE